MMEITTIGITQDEAAEKLNAYTSAQRKRLTELDRALYSGYKAIAEGLPVIDINEAIKQAGVFEDQWTPKIAIARADAERLYFDRTFESSLLTGRFQTWAGSWSEPANQALYAGDEEKIKQQGIWPYANEAGLMMMLPGGTIPEPPEEKRKRRNFIREIWAALVPPIPIQFRPREQEIRNYFVLWEVEEWTPFQSLARAPADPLLLQRIAHPIYTVVAQWDLSPLEQRLLESFRTRGA
jgi:hypothetical protein